MSFFAVIMYSVVMVVLGYMIGHGTGKEEGYIEGASEQYKANR